MCVCVWVGVFEVIRCILLHYSTMKMVDLTAQNMVTTASRNRREWGEELTRILAANGTDYAVCIRCPPVFLFQRICVLKAL